MSTATKLPTHVRSNVPGEGPMPFVDIDAHQKDMARRRAEHDAKKKVLRDCIDPNKARRYELKKTMFMHTVTAEWFGQGKDGPGFHGPFVRDIPAHNESDAWAKFCDLIGEWPSRRDCDVTIKVGKQLTFEQVEAAISGSVDEPGETRRYADTKQQKSRKR